MVSRCILGLVGFLAVVSGQRLGCEPPHDHYPFCDSNLSVSSRVKDLISRIPDSIKPNLLTARGQGGSGKYIQVTTLFQNYFTILWYATPLILLCHPL